MPFESDLRRPRRLSDSALVTPSAAVDRSHARPTRSASDLGNIGALGPSGIVRTSLPEDEVWEDIPLTPRLNGQRSHSAVDLRLGMAGSHLRSRSEGNTSSRRGSSEDDRASTIYGSTREFPTLEQLLELERDSDTESDGYITAPEDYDESDAESEDSVRAVLGSQRRSTDPEIVPAREDAHAAQQATTSQTSTSAAQAPQSLWDRRAEGYKVGYLLMDTVSALVAAVGWVLNRKIPLFRPVGQALADTLHFTLATLDAAHSGNKVKTGGKAGSMVGRGLAATSSLVGKSEPATSREMNPSVWAAHTVGRGLVAYDAYRGGKTAAAAGQFAASAMALIGLVGTTLERFHATTPAFLALETISNFYTTAPPIGGAIQGARDSKVRMPWLRDSGVVAKELIALGTGMGAIASTLLQVYSLKDKEQGTNDSAHFASLIGGLGSAGWFMSTIGYSMVMMIDLRPPPAPDIEANPGNSSDEPPPPDPGAGTSGVAV